MLSKGVVDPIGATLCYDRAVGVQFQLRCVFGGGPRSRSLAESSRGWVPIQMVFYILQFRKLCANGIYNAFKDNTAYPVEKSMM